VSALSFRKAVACALLVASRALAADETAVRELVRAVDYEPSWSPDGTSVVFVSNRNGAMNVYRMNPDGGDLRRLTSHAGPDDTPAWSPDGTTIAFVSEVDGNPEIYLVGADGAGLRRLTDHPGIDLHPTWSLDSRRLLFNTSRYAAKPEDPDRIDVCELTIEGGAVRCFTEGGINTYASWSPDGKTILFRRSRGDDKSQIVTLRAADEKLTELTPGEKFDGWPAWSAGGDRVVFASDRSGEFQLYVMNADGGAVRRILERPGRYTNPRWSPEGETILFTGRAPGDGDLELYRMPVPD
jgi:Tol biopolymer transport system component